MLTCTKQCPQCELESINSKYLKKKERGQKL